MKVVINVCYGGFSLSPEALLWMYERGAKDLATPVKEYWQSERDEDSLLGYKKNIAKWRDYLKAPDESRTSFLTVFTPDEQFVLNGGREVKRDDPLLIECIETLGDKANGDCAKLKIVEIPDGTDYIVDEYDGNEHIAEKHETWS